MLEESKDQGTGSDNTEESEHELEKTDAELGLEPGDKKFCHAYYQPEYKNLR